MRLTYRLKCVLIFVILCLLCVILSYKKVFNVFKFPNDMSVNKLMKFVPVIAMNRNVTTMFTFKSEHYNYFTPPNYKIIDWHDYALIEKEKQRQGIGEQGKPASVQGEDEITAIKAMLQYRVHAALSDLIPLNRSLPDVRHPKCKRKLYLESLPTVSVIVPFYNEHLNTLLRTVYSIINRSPEKLIKEILLVDDASSTEKFDNLKEKLDEYVQENFPKVKVVRMTKRQGVVGARLAGAKLATADVLIFLDSHMEVNVNWLPPLIEPIAMDYKTAVVPLIDVINRENFEYNETDSGARGAFDWFGNYVRIPLSPMDVSSLPEPFETPIMKGVVAISRHFFWELEGYDTKLEIWGAEQVELSFKIWMCGGRLLEAPCSRVGHVVRDTNSIYYNSTKNIIRNYRRVFEVWMDEYADFMYIYYPEIRNADPGDLTKQKAFRQQCKSFKWVLSEVAYDIIQNNSLVYPKSNPEGRIKPLGRDKMCLEGVNHEALDQIVLTRCTPSPAQLFLFEWSKEIRTFKTSQCWFVENALKEKHVQLSCCNDPMAAMVRQWRYIEDQKFIEHLASGLCLDHDEFSLDVFVNHCNEDLKTQRWVLDYNEVTLYSFNWEKE